VTANARAAATANAWMAAMGKYKDGGNGICKDSGNGALIGKAVSNEDAGDMGNWPKKKCTMCVCGNL